MDWGHNTQYTTAIGTGECAGAIVDLVDVIIRNAGIKLKKAELALAQKAYADSIFYSYSSFIETAKAILIKEDKSCSTQYEIITEFGKLYNNRLKILEKSSFHNVVMQINENEPAENFAQQCLQAANEFVAEVTSFI